MGHRFFLIRYNVAMWATRRQKMKRLLQILPLPQLALFMSSTFWAVGQTAPNVGARLDPRDAVQASCWEKTDFGSHFAHSRSLFSPDQRLYRKEGVAEEAQPVKPVSYSVIKAGLVGLTRYLATYWAGRNVRSNALSPGGVYVSQEEEFVTRLTSWPVIARSKKLIGRRNTWPYTFSRMRCTDRIARPASRVSCR